MKVILSPRRRGLHLSPSHFRPKSSQLGVAIYSVKRYRIRNRELAWQLSARSAVCIAAAAPLARRCITGRAHILASACMNRMRRFQGAAPRLRPQEFGSGTRSQPLEAKRSPLALEAAVRPDDSRQGYVACWEMLRPLVRRRSSRPPSARKQWPPRV
jgi:hypothetical protein